MTKDTQVGSRLKARTRLAAVALTALAAGALSLAPAQAESEAPMKDAAAESYDVLVFSKTAGFRHDSIPAGIKTIQKLGAENGFEVTATEDASVFSDDGLADYEVVLWLSTTGDVLNADQQAAFERYIQDGGGYVGVHAASDTEYDWPWYGGLVGAYFSGHPDQQVATVQVRGKANPAMAHLPNRWTRWDEWYSFQDQPAEDVRVLANLDERSYDPGEHAMGEDHPIVWCHEYDGGRSFYTGMGHTIESYYRADFRQHLLGGIEQVAGVSKFNCGGE